MTAIICNLDERRYQSKVTREIYTEKEWREIIKAGIDEGLTVDTTTFERMLLTGRLVEVKASSSSDMRSGGKFI